MRMRSTQACTVINRLAKLPKSYTDMGCNGSGMSIKKSPSSSCPSIETEHRVFY